MPEPDFANLETNEAESNAEYMSEIQYQLQGSREDDEAELQSYLSCTVTHSKPDVLHGSKIALQTLYSKPLWLDCDTHHFCVKAGCPKLYMEGDDWKNCRGVVFEIYRAAGAGNVKVGDFVGLYFRPKKEWFSVYGGQAHRSVCPGTPNVKYGFATREKWEECVGEAFQIYASGKYYNDPIKDHDEVAFYYAKDKKWVSFVGSPPHLDPCPGETRPPPAERFDFCYGEVAELWLE